MQMTSSAEHKQQEIPKYKFQQCTDWATGVLQIIVNLHVFVGDLLLHFLLFSFFPILPMTSFAEVEDSQILSHFSINTEVTDDFGIVYRSSNTKE